MDRKKIDITVIAFVLSFFIGAILLHLLPALLAGMITFVLMRYSENMLIKHSKFGKRSRIVATILISLLIIFLLTLTFGYLFSWISRTVKNTDEILAQITLVIDSSIQILPHSLAKFVPQDVDTIKANALGFTQEHLLTLRDIAKSTTHALVTMLLGMIIGIMIAASDIPASSKPLVLSIRQKTDSLIQCFKHVVTAQVVIAGFNATMTAIFLLIIMPLLGFDFPFVKLIIVMTFVFGLIPIVGNIIVNVVVLLIGVSVSVYAGVLALAFLIFIHKFEYFLNAKIIGSRIEAKAWELLLAMLIMESIFGIPGLISAPILYAYVKKEMQERAWI